MSVTAEKLPRGVGRVPAWWMEVTPHYTLDLEEDDARRQREEQMALYYAQLAAADDGSYVGVDGGGPMLDGNGNPIADKGGWKSQWTGRAEKQEGGEAPVTPTKSVLFGGRNFQPGSEGWDPKQWGIDESDPDYEAYLKGTKLPPQYVEAMKKFGEANNMGAPPEEFISSLNSANRYGRSAEKPAFQPDWMKKKLRSTNAGSNIRSGVYNDSPNKHLRRVQGDDTAETALATLHAPEVYVEDENNGAPEPESAAPETPTAAETSTTERPRHTFNQYYHNASTQQAAAVDSKAANPPTSQQEEPELGEDEYYEEVVEYVEEYVTTDEDEVAEYEEAAPAAGLQDLQAILAAKQAELRRLQGLS